VDDTLYKVPKQRFVNGSSFFRDMFKLPQGDGVVEGKDDDHPIRLPDTIVKAEFETLIKAIYSSSMYVPHKRKLWHILINCHHRGEDLDDFKKEDWMCCLKLSTLWDFKRLRQLSIARLSNKSMPAPVLPNINIAASPAEKLALGMQYRVPDWVQGVSELVKTSHLSFTVDDKALLGSEAILHVWQIREDVRADWERQSREGHIICSRGHGSGYMRARSTNIGEWRTVVSCTSCGNSWTADLNDTAQTLSMIEAAIRERFRDAYEVDDDAISTVGS